MRGPEQRGMSPAVPLFTISFGAVRGGKRQRRPIGDSAERHPGVERAAGSGRAVERARRFLGRSCSFRKRYLFFQPGQRRPTNDCLYTAKYSLQVNTRHYLQHPYTLRFFVSI